jgi:cell shape-determining protein MreC
MKEFKYLQVVAAIVLLILLNFILGGVFKNMLSFAGEPLVTWGYKSGNSVKLFFTAIQTFDKVDDELIRTKAELAKYEADNALYLLLAQENAQLKAQLNIEDTTTKFVEAQVLANGVFEKKDQVILNKGKSGKVSVGDVVFIENYYVGLIKDEPLQGSSECILPSHKDSYLQVLIVPSVAITNIKEIKLDGVKYSKGVMSGNINGIVIQNIPQADTISEGDYVIVNDEKIGRYLVVGKIEKVEGVASEATRKALVEPFLNYSELRYVFIDIND